MGAVSNVLPAQRGLYVVIGAKLSRFQSRLRVYNIYGQTKFGGLQYYLHNFYSAQYEERELVTISVFSHFLGH